MLKLVATVWSLVAPLTAIAAVVSAAAQTPPASARAAIAPTGRLRAGFNYGNVVLASRTPSGELQGVAVDLARALGQWLNVEVDLVPYAAAGTMAADAPNGKWDVAFLGADPDRTDVRFTAPYMEIEATLLVPVASPIRTIADVDRPGVRVTATARSAYALYMARSFKQAAVVELPADEAQAAFFGGNANALAALREALLILADQHPGYRVLDETLVTAQQAVGVPKGHESALPYLDTFLNGVKASGMVTRSIAATRARGVRAAR